MIVVRRRVLTKTFKLHLSLRGLLVVSSLLFLAGCNPTEIASSGQRINSGYTNSALSNKAYIYRDSPAIIKGSDYGPSVNMKSIIDQSNPEIITNKSQLKGDCTFDVLTSFTSLDCIHTFAGKSAAQQSITRNPDGTWIFPVNSAEFYQVNGHYHVQTIVNKFFDKLKFGYEHLHGTLSPWLPKATPSYLPETGMFWFQAITPANDNYFRNSFLSNYALCNFDQNASFSPAGPEICMGGWAAKPNFFLVQDPSIVYHELGHAFVAIMMNFRNGTPNGLGNDYHALRSNLGGYGYDEAGSLGEGIADYFSFLMNGRTHLGEWGLKFSQNSRPMAEDDAQHIPGLDTTSEGRLSYPQYILYNSNRPTVPDEDVHLAGQIVSHYLVALTKSFQNNCGIPTNELHDKSTTYVMMLLSETLAEIGDLRGIGIDQMFGSPYPLTYPYRFNNMDENSSFLWNQLINPINFRRFFQVFGKNILKYMTNGLCSGFSQDESEKLLDDYGLLLFKTYNDDGSSTKDKFVQYDRLTGVVSTNPSPVAPTPISEDNRRKSVLISKQLLELKDSTDDDNISTYIIVDDQENMGLLMENLLFKGFPVSSTSSVSGVEYNNSNIRISPGEIVAVIPNLVNKSNSIMAGVQLLATDWDHVHITDNVNGNFKPCVIDNVTTTAQGAEAANTCGTTMINYKRNVKDSLTGLFASEAAAPVCMVQLEEGEVTRWVSQNEYRKKQGLSLLDKDCLGYGGNEYTEDFTFNPHECLIRVLPGANEAYFSKIDPQKSYLETMKDTNPNHIFDPGSAIVLEVNKWIPPGTKFRCRLRARFSNCSDCYTTPNDGNPLDGIEDDFIDADYNGAKPYQIINMEFDVND